MLNGSTLRILSKKFAVTGVNIIAPPEMKENMVWRSFGQSASICTAWSSRDENRKYFVYPDKSVNGAPDCADLLRQNLIHKFLRLKEVRPDITDAWVKSAEASDITQNTDIGIEFIPHSDRMPYKTVMHSGKNAPIRSWRCPVRVSAPIPVQRLVWALGLGSMNSQGYGLVQEGTYAD
jgi:CRISPR/Cas system endoribonuclease Cas6 (RAMP superfamily)